MGEATKPRLTRVHVWLDEDTIEAAGRVAKRDPCTRRGAAPDDQGLGQGRDGESAPGRVAGRR